MRGEGLVIAGVSVGVSLAGETSSAWSASEGVRNNENAELCQ